ncbi:hypothetical protein HZC53_03155 [Candidatus Uhrbacteria bacterium]|nr:hypothetical protein [Candidatus Uhrbacteria bacterium]
MLNFEYLNIPREDSDFEEEPEDELASAGFRVINNDGDEDEEVVVVDGVEKELEDAAEVVEDDEDEEDDEDGPVDGLAELEELEKGVADIPIGFDQDED